MDRRERRLHPEEALRCLIESVQARIWTAVPAVVQSFNAAKMTVNVQPALSCQVKNAKGQWQTLALPQLTDCPVVFPGGGGCTLTFPVEQGDECLVVFASRCIDGWWSQGMSAGAAIPGVPEVRMHNLSDGFALVGVRSSPRAYTPVVGGAQLQSDDGQAYVQLNPSTHAVKAVAAGGINLNGVTIDSSGNLVTSGTVKGSDCQTSAGISLANHVHTGVQTGSGNTGPATG